MNTLQCTAQPLMHGTYIIQGDLVHESSTRPHLVYHHAIGSKDQQVSSLLHERTVEISATDEVRIDYCLHFGIADSAPKYKYVCTSGYTISSSNLETNVKVTSNDTEETKSSVLSTKQMLFNNGDQFVKPGGRNVHPAADKAKLSDWLAKHKRSSTETRVHEHTFVNAKGNNVFSNKRLKLATDSVF